MRDFDLKLWLGILTVAVLVAFSFLVKNAVQISKIVGILEMHNEVILQKK